MKKKEDIKIIRERFISIYCKKKGWDQNNLSPSQLIEIVQKKEFKS